MNAIAPLLVVAALAVAACTSGAETAAVRPAGATPEAAAGTDAPRPFEGQRARIVTIGGSYMFGRMVARRDAWPSQLDRLLGPVVPVDVVANLAEGGHTSQDIIDEQLDLVESYRPDLVIIQFGANDVFALALADLTLAQFRDNVVTVLDRLLDILPPSRLAVVTVPDWSQTPLGRLRTGGHDIAGLFREVNGAMRQLADERDITVIDVSAVSDRIGEDPSLLLNGFDPSEKQYAGWVELIAPRVVEALAQPLP